MSKMIQIRNVPEALHRKLKMRAAERGVTLSDFLLEQAEQAAERPSLEEMLARLSSLEPVSLDEDPTVTIRRHRDTE